MADACRSCDHTVHRESQCITILQKKKKIRCNYPFIYSTLYSIQDVWCHWWCHHKCQMLGREGLVSLLGGGAHRHVCRTVCSYVSLPICRQWTKYAFLELTDPSQVEWVLGLHNTPIPNCPSKVSCLSCDLYRLSWDKKHVTHMDCHVTWCMLFIDCHVTCIDCHVTCIDCHMTCIDCHVTCMCSSRVISVHLTQKQFVLNRAGRSMWVYWLCCYWSHDHHCIAFWSLSTSQCPTTPTDLSDSCHTLLMDACTISPQPCQQQIVHI